MKLSRRYLIKIGFLSIVGIIVLPLGICGLMQKNSSLTLGYFQTSFPIPLTLEPVRWDATTDYYVLTAQRNRVEFLPGRKTEIWGYNSIMPGPTIRQRGERRIPHWFRFLEVLTPTSTLPTRTFLFKKEHGKWVINHLGWGHDRINVNPAAGALKWASAGQILSLLHLQPPIAQFPPPLLFKHHED